MRRQMRYLGLTINSQWTFDPHFKLLVPKVTAAANALCGPLRNIGGAEMGVRRLYEGVVRSRVLYGAPIWAEDLMASCRSLVLLRRLQRTTVIRIARGYRTVSYASATVLAASPPLLRAAGHRTPTGVRTSEGPALGRACDDAAVRRLVGTEHPRRGKTGDLGAMALSAGRRGRCKQASATHVVSLRSVH